MGGLRRVSFGVFWFPRRKWRVMAQRATRSSYSHSTVDPSMEDIEDIEDVVAMPLLLWIGRGGRC